MRGPSHLWLLFLAIPCLARADEASGRVTGGMEARMTTFHERRTEILAPGLAGHVEFPNGTYVRAHSLVDVITSSSVAVDIIASASVGVDPLARGSFRERRVEGSLTFGGTSRRLDDRLRMEGSVRYSHEPDYQSYSGSVSGSLDLDERARTIRFAGAFSRDELFQTQRTTDPSTGEVTKKYVRVDQGDGFSSFVGSVGYGQVLSPVVAIDVGYEFSYLTGYLGNPYRRVIVDGLVERERVPDSRHRHTASLTLRLARPRVKGALHLNLRGYTDDWAIHAIAAETRWYQQFTRYLMARGRFRYYQQAAASFDSDQDVNAPSYPFGARYTTANPRYSAMRSLEFGAAFVTRLGFLGPGRHGLDAAEIEFAVDYRLSDNRFGNATTASFVFRMPFR